MLTLYLLFGILYAAILVGLYFLWTRKTIPDNQTGNYPKVSLLIPFRNEITNIEVIFKAVSLLNPAPHEVIWIDDHSDDNSFDLLNENIIKLCRPAQMKLIKNKGFGKKDAVSTAIEASKGDWILTTDADCHLPADWLLGIFPHLNSSSIKFFSGPVFINSSKGFFNAFQQLDWAGIALLSNAGVLLGKPLMASAANMGYRREAFKSINGYQTNDSVLSGDDEFLLKAVVKAYGPESIVYNKKLFVKTNAHRTWRELFEQRARWISKWKSHGSLSHALTSIISLLLQVFFLSTFVLLFFGQLGVLLFTAIWTLKILSEWAILSKVLKYFSLEVRWMFYPLASIAYPFYVLGCIFRLTKGGILWKGRKIKKSYL